MDTRRMGDTGGTQARPNVREMVTLGIIVAVWYSASAGAGSSTRRVLTSWPAPLLLCTCHFVASVAFGAVLIHGLRVYTYVPVRPAVSGTVWKIAAAYATGFLSLTATMVYVNVSLSETFRAAEPMFTVVLARLIVGDTPTMPVLLSLVPISVGVGLAAKGAAGFNPLGAATAVVANVAFSLRSVWTKWLRRQHTKLGEKMGGVVLLYHVSVRGLALLLGAQALAVLLLPADVALPARNDSTPGSETSLLPLLALNALCFFTYNQMSFVVLSRVHVITHAVANGFRRVVTIIAAVLYFGIAVRPVNAAGMALAVAGVLCYAYARSLPPPTPARVGAPAKRPSAGTSARAARGRAES